MSAGSTSTVTLHGGGGNHRPTSELLEQFEGRAIGDTREHDGRRKERKKAVGLSTPTSTSLTQILQTGQRYDALPAAFAHDACETGERCNIGELVESKQEASTAVVGVLGGVHNFVNHPDNERRGDCLMTTWRYNVELMRAG